MTNDPAGAGAGRDGSRLRAKVEEWRENSTRAMANAKNPHIATLDRRQCEGVSQAYEQCADELDAILAVPDPLASDTGQWQISDREVERIRKFWNKPPNPTLCSACKKEIPAPSYVSAAGGMFGDPPCPHCGARAGWTSTFTTGGRDAKEDINALLNRLAASAPLASSSAPQGHSAKEK